MPTLQGPSLFDADAHGRDEWPGYRETLLEYHSTLEALGKAFLPLWAISLDLPKDHFDGLFTKPHCNLRLLHYPPQPGVGGGQYGIDSSDVPTSQLVLIEAPDAEQRDGEDLPPLPAGSTAPSEVELEDALARVSPPANDAIEDQAVEPGPIDA